MSNVRFILRSIYTYMVRIWRLFLQPIRLRPSAAGDGHGNFFQKMLFWEKGGKVVKSNGLPAFPSCSRSLVSTPEAVAPRGVSRLLASRRCKPIYCFLCGASYPLAKFTLCRYVLYPICATTALSILSYPLAPFQRLLAI